jgi:hypothetical protein
MTCHRYATLQVRLYSPGHPYNNERRKVASQYREIVASICHEHGQNVGGLGEGQQNLITARKNSERGKITLLVLDRDVIRREFFVTFGKLVVNLNEGRHLERRFVTTSTIRRRLYVQDRKPCHRGWFFVYVDLERLVLVEKTHALLLDDEPVRIFTMPDCVRVFSCTQHSFQVDAMGAWTILKTHKTTRDDWWRNTYMSPVSRYRTVVMPYAGRPYCDRQRTKE